MTITLHCFGESGNAYKAALALELSGLDWESAKPARMISAGSIRWERCRYWSMAT